MNIEISPFGSLLVYKKGYTPEFVYNTIKERSLKGLRIFAQLKEQRLENIDFLKDYSFLTHLDVTSVVDYDLGFLSHLSNLKYLSVNIEGKSVIDVESLSKLEKFIISWNKHKIRGLENVKTLEELFLFEYEKQDFKVVENLPQIKNLVIKTASVKSAEGLSDLKNLENLLLGNCRSLRSIKDIADKPELKELTFDGCPKIGNFDSLKDLPKLESLSINNCKQIDSISFVKNLPSLNNLSLLESTDVADGDLSPAENIPDVYYKHRNHYNIKIVNPEHEARIKRNREKIKEFAKQLKPKS